MIKLVAGYTATVGYIAKLLNWTAACSWLW